MTISAEALLQALDRFADTFPYILLPTADRDWDTTPKNWILSRARELDAARPQPAAKALDEERCKFQRETIRTSELTNMLIRWLEIYEPGHNYGHDFMSCIRCRLVHESKELLAKPINAPASVPVSDAVRALVEDMRDNGLRMDLNPTHVIGDEETESFWHEYIRRADENVRKRAAAALAGSAGEPIVDDWRQAFAEWFNGDGAQGSVERCTGWIVCRARELSEARK